MMFLMGFFEQSHSISDRGTGESIKLSSLPEFIFTFLIAELYLTVSPKAEKNPSDKVDFGPVKSEYIHEIGDCFPH